MTKVFIGGSRNVSRLNAYLKQRLDNIMAKDFPILVGDANGADKAVQTYLHSKGYRFVEVFCTDGMCRNNVGNWTIRNIPSETRERNAQFHSVKDRAMAKEATVGLMMWDGKSVGTLLNVFRLLNLHKKAVVYTVPKKSFREFKSGSEWEEFIASCNPGLRQKVEERKSQEAPAKDVPPVQTALLV